MGFCGAKWGDSRQVGRLDGSDLKFGGWGLEAAGLSAALRSGRDDRSVLEGVASRQSCGRSRSRSLRDDRLKG